MPITSPEEKFAHELADMYDAEHQFLEAMGKMRDMASDQKLQTMLEEHMQETEEQIANLEQVFAEMGKEPERQECMGAKGLVGEAQKMMQETESPELRDAVIAGAATKAEHYEMVAYADLIDGAEMMKKRKWPTCLRITASRNYRPPVSWSVSHRSWERLRPELTGADRVSRGFGSSAGRVSAPIR